MSIIDCPVKSCNSETEAFSCVSKGASMEADKRTETRPTAGLRGASWSPELLPSTMKTQVVPVGTVDGAQIVGFHYYCGGESAVVMIMHPRELLATHYMVPYLLRAGFACW